MPSETHDEDTAVVQGTADENLVSEIGSPTGPFSVSTRVGIMTALLVSKRATFTELLLAVKSPKSSLNKNLGILEDHGFIRQRRGFLPTMGPRMIIWITPKGEETIKKYLELMRLLADKFLGIKATESDGTQYHLSNTPTQLSELIAMGDQTCGVLPSNLYCSLTSKVHLLDCLGGNVDARSNFLDRDNSLNLWNQRPSPIDTLEDYGLVMQP